MKRKITWKIENIAAKSANIEYSVNAMKNSNSFLAPLPTNTFNLEELSAQNTKIKKKLHEEWFLMCSGNIKLATSQELYHRGIESMSIHPKRAANCLWLALIFGESEAAFPLSTMINYQDELCTIILAIGQHYSNYRLSQENDVVKEIYTELDLAKQHYRDNISIGMLACQHVLILNILKMYNMENILSYTLLKSLSFYLHQFYRLLINCSEDKNTKLNVIDKLTDKELWTNESEEDLKSCIEDNDHILYSFSPINDSHHHKNPSNHLQEDHAVDVDKTGQLSNEALWINYVRPFLENNTTSLDEVEQFADEILSSNDLGTPLENHDHDLYHLEILTNKDVEEALQSMGEILHTQKS